MAEVTAAMVKELREQTGAGMMDCKKALNETNGNMEEAVEVLRKNGQAKAVKKENRIAAEGICCVAVDGDSAAAVVEVNSETDFVAKNDTFRQFVEAVARQALKSGASDMDAFMEEKWNEDESKTVKEALVDRIAVIGEKLSIRRFEKLETSEGCVVSYVHGGGRIGVILQAKANVVNDAVKEAFTNLAMQIAALNPKYVVTGDVPEDYKEHEKEIIAAQVAQDPKMAGKPDQIVQGAVMGRLNKQLKEICLLEQVYVKDPEGKQTVAQYIAQVAKETGADLSVVKFVRFETGEGLEKKHEDFAAEVAAQMNV